MQFKDVYIQDQYPLRILFFVSLEKISRNSFDSLNENTEKPDRKSQVFLYLSGRTGETVWETVARPGPHLSSKTTTISQIVGSFGCLRPDLGRGAGNRTRTTRSQTAYTTTMLHPDPDRDENQEAETSKRTPNRVHYHYATPRCSERSHKACDHPTL
jgi:hypothetical protein